MVVIGAVREGGLCLLGAFLVEWALSQTGQIFIPNSAALLSCRSPSVNGLFPLVQYRSWLSGSGQMLSNEDEAILASIIRLYFCPSSINLDINRLSLSIGWSSRMNLHRKYILSVFIYGKCSLQEVKHLLLKRITVQPWGAAATVGPWRSGIRLIGTVKAGGRAYKYLGERNLGSKYLRVL